MDEAAIEKAGIQPLEPWLEAIDGIKDPASLTKLLGRMQYELGTGIVFEQSAAQDFGDATQVVGMIWQAGLGMPEREYYLESTPKMTELRNKYEAHVAAMMELAGEPAAKAKASAKKVLQIETALAKAWMSKEDRREPKKINHRASKADSREGRARHRVGRVARRRACEGRRDLQRRPARLHEGARGDAERRRFDVPEGGQGLGRGLEDVPPLAPLPRQRQRARAEVRRREVPLAAGAHRRREAPRPLEALRARRSTPRWARRSRSPS